MKKILLFLLMGLAFGITGTSGTDVSIKSMPAVTVSNQPTTISVTNLQPTTAILWQDVDGTPKGFKYADGLPRYSSTTYLYSIAEGEVTRHASFYKVGYNSDIDNVEETLWTVGGTYVFPAITSQNWEVYSSSAEDNIAGTGVQVIRLEYLDSGFNEKTITFAPTGTTPTTLNVADLFRVERYYAIRCGSAGNAVGAIDIRHVTNTPIYGRIAAGEDRSLQCIYTVPTGNTLYITDITASSGNPSAGRYTRFKTKANYDSDAGALNFLRTHSTFSVQDGSNQIILQLPTSFPAGTDIIMTAISDAASADAICTGALRGWIEW